MRLIRLAARPVLVAPAPSRGFTAAPTAAFRRALSAAARHRVQIGPRPEDFESAVREALPLAHSPAARHLPGFLPARRD